MKEQLKDSNSKESLLLEKLKKDWGEFSKNPYYLLNQRI